MIRRLFLIAAALALLLGAVYVTAASALSPVRQETMAKTRIFAYRGWQSTGIRVEKRDRLTIRAHGEWLYTPGEHHGPEGHARFPAPTFYPIPSYHETNGPHSVVPGGVLIGRIGDSREPFIVGTGTLIVSPEQGTLYLRINDDILSDNEGWVEVEIQVKTPEVEEP